MGITSIRVPHSGQVTRRLAGNLSKVTSLPHRVHFTADLPLLFLYSLALSPRPLH